MGFLDKINAAKNTAAAAEKKVNPLLLKRTPAAASPAPEEEKAVANGPVPGAAAPAGRGRSQGRPMLGGRPADTALRPDTSMPPCRSAMRRSRGRIYRSPGRRYSTNRHTALPYNAPRLPFSARSSAEAGGRRP